jgi:hypothetical protein
MWKFDMRRSRHETYPSAKAFLKFAKWAECEAKHVALARTIAEACLSELEPGGGGGALLLEAEGVEMATLIRSPWRPTIIR